MTDAEGSRRSLLQAAPNVGADECLFFEHTNFRGKHYGPLRGFVQNVGRDANDRISSLVCGDNVYVKVYEDGSNGGVYSKGAERQYIKAERDLRRQGFNDKITSLEVIPLSQQVAIIQYDRNNVDNYFQLVTESARKLPLAELQRMGFTNDAIDELRIPAGRIVEARINDDIRDCLGDPAPGSGSPIRLCEHGSPGLVETHIFGEGIIKLYDRTIPRNCYRPNKCLNCDQICTITHLSDQVSSLIIRNSE